MIVSFGDVIQVCRVHLDRCIEEDPGNVSGGPMHYPHDGLKEKNLEDWEKFLGCLR